MKLLEYYSWMAMISFPLAHFLQLIKIINEQHAKDVSYLTFGTLILANIASFIYTNKALDLRSWFNFIIPSVLQLLIILIILNKEHQSKETLLFLISFAIIVPISIYYYLHASEYLRNFIGFFPAFLFPVSIIFTLYKLYNNKSKQQANSIFSWYLMVFGMIGAYIVDERYLELKSIFAFLVPALLSGIVVYKIYQDKKAIHKLKKPIKASKI